MGGQFNAFVLRFLKDTRGTTATEYAMIAAGLAVTIVGALSALFGTLGGIYAAIEGGVD